MFATKLHRDRCNFAAGKGTRKAASRWFWPPSISPEGGGLGRRQCEVQSCPQIRTDFKDFCFAQTDRQFSIFNLQLHTDLQKYKIIRI